MTNIQQAFVRQQSEEQGQAEETHRQMREAIERLNSSFDAQLSRSSHPSPLPHEGSHLISLAENSGYLKDSGLGPEKKGDVLEVCFGLYMLASCYGVNLMRLFKMDSTHMPTWYTQWAMLARDMYVSSMGGLDLFCPHPANIEGGEKRWTPCRIESACKYLHLVSKLTLDETYSTLGGKNSQKGTVVIQDPIRPFCGDQVAKTTKWVMFKSAKEAPWTHLTVCVASTQCDGMGQGLDLRPHLSPQKRGVKLAHEWPDLIIAKRG